jgi:hypothetical protein
MIKRIWRGWAVGEAAEAYERLLRDEIFPGIFAREIAGFEGIDLLRRAHGDEVEFMTIMSFADIEAARRFAGPDWERAVVPAPARALLSHFDDIAAHYERRAELR